MLLIITVIIILLLYHAQKNIYSRYWDKGVEVKLSFDREEAYEGETVTLIQEITNRKILPMPMLSVKFVTDRSFLFEDLDNVCVTDQFYRNDVFSIMGNQIVTRKLPFTPGKRGYYGISNVDLITKDLFMKHSYAKNSKNQCYLYVYPSFLNMTQFEVSYQTILGEYIARKSLVEDPFEFKGIREYQPYDNYRNINWKSTAKNNVLQVNTYNPTSNYEVKIIVNMNTHTMFHQDMIQEISIKIAATLANRFIRDFVPLGIITNAFDLITKEPVMVETGSSAAHMNMILKKLARIDNKNKPRDFIKLCEEEMKKEQHTFYILISNERNEDAICWYQRKKEEKVPMVWIVPEFKDFAIDINQKDVYPWEVTMND